MERSDNPDGENLSVFQIKLNQSFSVQGGCQFLVVYPDVRVRISISTL